MKIGNVRCDPSVSRSVYVPPASLRAPWSPACDQKVLTSWNGLMIAALVNASVVLDEPSWLQNAARAFLFIDGKMGHHGERLGHSWRDGRLLVPGLASDHAAMIRAALALHEATGG